MSDFEAYISGLRELDNPLILKWSNTPREPGFQ